MIENIAYEFLSSILVSRLTETEYANPKPVRHTVEVRDISRMKNNPIIEVT
jgi:hypothetical protein